MTTVHETQRREVPPWMRKARRILDILATGGTILLTEPKKDRR